jgi:hypothetical protein
MPMTLADAINDHHAELLRAVEQVEACLAARTTGDELTAAIETVRRGLLAHDLTAERFVVAPLRDLRLLDADRLAALEHEADRLSQDAIGLARGQPDRAAVAAFVRRIRAHVERKARTVVPAARSALAGGRLTPVPRWYVDEVYGLQGGGSESWAEEWLG